jgi:hypothetical protein
MAYLFRQKLNIEEITGIAQLRRKVLIYEPEEYLAALYMHYLRSHNFDIKDCPDLVQIKEHIASFNPELLVFSTDFQTAFSSASSLSQSFPSLKIVTTGYNTDNERVSQFMGLGVLSHLNRRFSRPEDLSTIIKTLLNN